MNELITLKNYLEGHIGDGVFGNKPITWNELIEVLKDIEVDTQDIRDRRQVLLTELMNHCEAREKDLDKTAEITEARRKAAGNEGWRTQTP